MCRSQNDPDGPRQCSRHGRGTFSKSLGDANAVGDGPAATALIDGGVAASAPDGSHLADADGSYSNLDRGERVEAMLDDLKNQIAKLDTGAAWQNYLATAAKFHNYSLRNQILIALQTGGKARHVAGFKKWKEFGRTVDKGSKAIHILAPRVIRDRDDIDPKTEKPREKVVGFTSVSVFADYQTSGDPLPKPPIVSYDRSTGTAPAGMHDDMDKAITKHGFTVESEDLGPNSADGFTDFATKRVVVNSHYSDAHQAATKAHELAHIELGHGEKSREYHSGNGGLRPTMEVEAESAAYVINRSYGMETKESFSYIDGWAKGNPDEVTKAAENVSRACKNILAGLGK